MSKFDVKLSDKPAAIVAERQAALGLADDALAAAMEYENGKVVALIKSGAIKVPVNKVAALASALQIDGFNFLRAVMSESAPDIWQAIEGIAAPLGALHPTEISLIRHLRRLRGDQHIKPIAFDCKGVVALVLEAS